MPSDIRKFFAPKNSQSSSNSARPQVSTGTSTSGPKVSKTSAAKKKKRRVIDSDDDEDEEATSVKVNTAPHRSDKKILENPAESTDTSTYFASSGKNKINRSSAVSNGTISIPVTEAKKDYRIANGQSNTKKSVSKAKESTNTEQLDFINDDDVDFGNDIHGAEFKKDADDYEEDNLDVEMTDSIAEAEERKTKSRSTPKSRKRKAVSPDEESEEEVAPKKKSSKGKTAEPASKKFRTSKKKEAQPESEEIQRILGEVETVRVPTPPPRDNDQKFNFRDFVQRDKQPTSGVAAEMPDGAENCLTGMTFVFTGTLPSLSRDDGVNLVKRYGGRVTTAPSKKTTYVVLGSDAGPKKLETIKVNNIKAISETGLFDLIRKLPANGGSGNAAKSYEEKKAKDEAQVRKLAKQMELEANDKHQEAATKGEEAAARESSQLWTSKYAPTAINQICGNKGQVEKLQKWLRDFPKNKKIHFAKRGAEGFSNLRAIMIHGPPGIGKTTAAHLVAKLEGYDVLEFNASDTRSKKLMESTLRGVLDNRSIVGYFAGGGRKIDSSKQKMLLIMDEVDGMSGGDRGGVGQLAQVCKKSDIPVICICNERKLPKMKPFDFVTYDLAFRRPDANMVRSRIASIAYREEMKVPPNVIDQLTEGTHADIRQIINMLSTYKSTAKTMDFDQSKAFVKAWEKHIVFKPWDIAQKLLGTEMFNPNSKKTLNDKIELYFNDHEFSYLMVQENYLKTNPSRCGNLQARERKFKALELADNAAHSISDGDLVDSMIHGPQQHWSLMPLHGVFSTVKPSSYMFGSWSGQRMSFTTWLGMNSKQSKLVRLTKEIQSHMRLRTSGDRHEIRQQYLPVFFNKLVRRLQVEGKDTIPDIIELMDDYYLTKDDWDSVLELGVGPMSDTTVKIESQTKSAFTRMYNYQAHPMPFMKASSVAATKSIKKEVPDIEDAFVESDEEPADDENSKADDEDDLSKDKYVKQPKKKTANKGIGKVVDGDISKKPGAKSGKGGRGGRGRGKK